MMHLTRPVVRLCGMALLLAAIVGPAGRAHAFSGSINYTGDLGPITAQRPLCICVYGKPDLTVRKGCLLYPRNDRTYDTGDLVERDYYAIAFVDIHINERRDADEPYQIFHARAGNPADPISAAATGVDFIFGDENLAEQPTATPTDVPPPSPTPSSSPTVQDTPIGGDTPTATPSMPAGIVGDCDGDGTVSVDELVRAVGIDLETQPLSACPPADSDGDGVVRIDELIAAINAALAAG